MTARDAKAHAKGAKAHAKAMRPWYKKKRFIIGGILAIFIIAAIASGGGDDDKSDSASSSKSDKSDSAATDSGDDEGESGDDEAAGNASSEVACKDADPDDKVDTENQDLYPDRPDSQGEDHEAAVGDCVRLAGYTTYVEDAAVESQDFGGPEVVVSVMVQNRDDKAQSFNQFNWNLLTPSGTVIDSTIYLGDDGLGSGDLVKGGEVTGKVAFDASEPGTYYVIYKPDPFNSARGIWKVDV